MRDLIKKILKEENYEFVSFEIVRTLTKDEISNIISEQNVSDLVTPELKREVKKYLYSVSPFKGVYRKKNGQKIVYNFEITLTDHWFERLFRRQDPKYAKHQNIINPHYTESIDMVVRNADKIAGFLENGDIKDRQEVAFFSKSGSKVSVIVKFSPTSISGNGYELIFKTQIKGPYFYDKQGTKTLGIY